MKKYGIFDTKDNVWLGDINGPKLFDEVMEINGHQADGFILARISAQMTETQLYGTDLAGRIRAKEYTDEVLHLKDERKTLMDGEAALKRIEGE